jgi:hypothetical protein
MTNFKLSFLLFICFHLAFDIHSIAQNDDSIVFRAIEDEIKRNMNNLEYRDFEKPCYINFKIINHFDYLIYTELGSLFQVDSMKSRGWSNRLIVGNYKLNDENFSYPYAGEKRGVGELAEVFPIEGSDYWGLRRSMWMKLNDIYLTAGESHRQKLKLIDEGKIKENDLILDDFTPSEQVELFVERESVKFGVDKLTELVKKLSRTYYEFNDFLDYSTASLQYSKNDIYFLDSEGSRYKLPKDILSLTVKIEKKQNTNKLIERELTLIAEAPDQLPDYGLIQKDITKLVEDFKRYEKAKDLNQDYSGPVLLLGRVAAETLLDNLFNSNHSLTAERNRLVLDYEGNVFFEEIQNDWQSKVGTRILPDSLDIRVLPTLKSFNNTRLLGSYPIDAEGIIPPDSLSLVEDGILKSMLSSRTPTSVSKASNGHASHYFYNGRISSSKGPSVVRVQANISTEQDSLKQIFINFAKGEGYQYAYIIKSIPSGISIMPYNIYSIDLKTGEEQPIKNAMLNSEISASNMRKLILSNDTMVINTLMNSDYFNRSQSTGQPVSYIGPSAIFVEEMSISSIKENTKLHTAEDYISNPLKRKQ